MTGGGALFAAWIVAGGGPVPEFNQVGIEQDLADAARVLAQVGGGPGRLLFASGAGDRTVQVAGRPPPLLPGDPDVASLAELFDPRGGRRATYRPTALRPDGPATAARLLKELRVALGAPSTEPLTVYIGGHGQMGATARENWVDLWGESSLTPASVAALLDEQPDHRPVRFVITACYSGGFGELAFAGADPAAGPARGDRCGLFAAPWDLPASGCDPNPDRAAHVGYAKRFLPALASGASLLEAHTEVRIHSTAPDVPTTTSERWLRQVAPKSGPGVPVALPEEERVEIALSARLALSSEDAAAALAMVERAVEDLDTRRGRAHTEEDRAWRTASASVLARWPTLNDPWHPDFQGTLQEHRVALGRHMAHHPSLLAWRRARSAVADLDDRTWALRSRSAPLERLTRASDNRTLAGRLKARGGPDWDHYQRLLRCERGLP